MERSSKFISLSGLSGILAGVYALIGASLAYFILYDNSIPIDPYIHRDPSTTEFWDGDINSLLLTLSSIGLFVLIASLISGIMLTRKKARQKGQRVWSSTSRSLLFHMATPLVSGGILILIFLFRGYYGIVSPSSLIFYGLALVSASNFTFTMVKYLGLCEIILGLIAACLPGYGLLFWAIGFGVLHIVYGSMMYFKYDR
ncbi:hypothetical protein MuYL_3919 [Mucilaginibacter xinganensis]|uniref:Uncharacterized protein n=2 Tax=Mucilaginibacter xinganensis TaxID=1234841 RepID=A0A223P1J1_9SPHI|nr:hypothetical protein MuYL_3919 [Mucilaginibacter xinganensis]